MATAVVTGANRGIGLELARQLHQRGDQVIAAVRSSSEDLEKLAVEVHEDVDIADGRAISQFANTLSGRAIDLLIHNAGVLSRESLDDLDLDRIRRQFEVNTLGPLRLTSALLPCLGAGSKVAIVSSRLGSMAHNTSGGNYGYRISKAAVNMAGVTLARDLQSRGVILILLHPGYVKTQLTGMAGDIDPDESAQGLIKRIDDATLESSGSFWHADGTELAW